MAIPTKYKVLINHLGVRIGLFTPDRAFDMVSNQQISKLKAPSLKLVELVSAEIMSIAKAAAAKVKIATSWNTATQLRMI